MHRFTIEEYHRLTQTGILHEDDNVELIEGRIVDMTPIGTKHASCVTRLNEIFSERLQRSVIISVQNPIYINEYSEPEPDIAILKRRSDFYSERLPCPDDILLIIEVADTSIEYDKVIKIPLYAKAKVQEVWIINLLDNAIEVYRSPSSEGYRIVTKIDHTLTVSPQSFPDVNITSAQILGIS